MDVAFLLDKYFKGTKDVSIDVFDAQTLNDVYKDIIRSMTSHFEIDSSIWFLVPVKRLIRTKSLTIGPMLQKSTTKHLWKQTNWRHYGRV